MPGPASNTATRTSTATRTNAAAGMGDAGVMFLNAPRATPRSRSVHNQPKRREWIVEICWVRENGIEAVAEDAAREVAAGDNGIVWVPLTTPTSGGWRC